MQNGGTSGGFRGCRTGLFGSASSPAAVASSAMAVSNPCKFSKKIALQKQQQTEEMVAFEVVLIELGTT
ncbi:CREB-regulated transcription coactivator 2 [Crotalus adamanteus]|uniref:CREB-regulated transcription coactivator 2 n=1 Tax=Crotalus adamanteus TaxID=8729 RepID=A0AAW1B326_CROAD